MNSIIQISSGTGPSEVRDFVKLLGEVVLERCADLSLDTKNIVYQGDEEAPRSLEIYLQDAPEGVLSSWSGTHCLIASSPQRGKKARKRWFVSLSVFRKGNTQNEIDLSARTLEISVCRAGGPGGQHVNKTSSAVRVHHIPSGIVVRCSSERSQALNKQAALSRLQEVIFERMEAKKKQTFGARRLRHYQLQRGAPVMSWTLNHRRDRLVEVR